MRKIEEDFFSVHNYLLFKQLVANRDGLSSRNVYNGMKKDWKKMFPERGEYFGVDTFYRCVKSLYSQNFIVKIGKPFVLRIKDSEYEKISKYVFSLVDLVE